MALPKNYTYKIVGVTFENNNGTDRQQLLKLFCAIKKSELIN